MSYSKSYSELIKLNSFEERFEYLKLTGVIGESTFGGKRYLNQEFYKSSEWKRCRNSIIIRDNGCDLGCEGYEIGGIIIVHHINPITIDDIIHRRPKIFDPENLISTSYKTHEAITYNGKVDFLIRKPIERKKNDTCLWR